MVIAMEDRFRVIDPGNSSKYEDTKQAASAKATSEVKAKTQSGEGCPYTVPTVHLPA